MTLAPAASAVCVDDLRIILEDLLSEYYGEPVFIRRLQRRVSRYSSSYRIENLEADLLGQNGCRLILKDTSPASVADFEHHVRPSSVCSPEREIEVYQDVLPEGLGTPCCYGAVISRELERYWLFLERVEGAALWQLGQIEIWQAAARWLARLHARCALSRAQGFFAQAESLITYDERYFRRWIARAEQFQRAVANEPRQARIFQRLVDGYEKVVAELAALPRTFVHGEFYPSNVLVREDPAGPPSGRMKIVGEDLACRRICPIDWEMAGVGPGAIDLAALTSGKWPEEAKALMIADYREALEWEGQEVPPVTELVRAVEICQLHLAVQWLGWAEEWSPPSQHAHDWLEEALHLTQRLGI